MAIREPIYRGKPVINLDGPQGNAFYLLGMVYELGRILSYSKVELDRIVDEMQSGDYENLIHVFDSYFGEYVDLERSKK